MKEEKTEISHSDWAISVPEEGGKVFYSKFESLDGSIKKKISCQMLDQIFKRMVLPCIEETRRLDRIGANDD